MRILLAGFRTAIGTYTGAVRPTRAVRRWAFSTQALALLVVLLTVVVLLSLLAAAAVVRRDLEDQYEQRALAIARSVAQDGDLARWVQTRPPSASGPVERRAESYRRATEALYVVVTDDTGTRFSHPDPGLVGRPVSTSAEEALSGHEVVAIETGTLGPSARGKVPLRDAAGHVVGEVSVGIGISEVHDRTVQVVLLLALLALAPLSLGLLGAFVLVRRLRRSTLGLEPEEMADLVREHAAVLGGIRDGVVAVDHRGRVTVANPEACRLLGSAPLRGSTLAEAGVPEEVQRLFTVEPAPEGELHVLGDRVVVVHRIAVQRDGRHLGEVLTLRDRTDLDDLAAELEATRAFTDALRAQAHEHRNRLHTLAGLLHLGHVDEAVEYLEELRTATTWVAGVDDPYLGGLLAAKTAVASEAGVTLQTTPETFVQGILTAPLDVVTVVGNLLDNAVRAAADGTRRPGLVEVTLVSDGDDLVVHVVDSGDGVPEGLTATVFDHGVTTQGSKGAAHGIGLALARVTARSHGGDIVLKDAGGPEPDPHGAVFEARLNGVLGSVGDLGTEPRRREATAG